MMQCDICVGKRATDRCTEKAVSGFVNDRGSKTYYFCINHTPQHWPGWTRIYYLGDESGIERHWREYEEESELEFDRILAHALGIIWDGKVLK